MDTNTQQPSGAETPFPMSSRIEYIPLALTDLHPLARKHSAAGLASLGKKMSQEGQLQNIVVCPMEGGRYQVICGAGRVTNAKDNGWEKILASIREGLSEFQKLQLMLSENEEREAESPIHQGVVYQGMMDAEEGMTQDKLAERLGLSRQTLREYLSLKALPAAIGQNAARAAFLGLKHYLQLLRLPGPDDRVKMAEEAAQGEWSVKELKAKIDKLLAPAVEKAAKKTISSNSGSREVGSAQADEQDWDSGFRFSREDARTIWVRLDRLLDPADGVEDLCDELRDEYQTWLEGKGSICDRIWLPETEEEMREFEAFAEASPGPTPLFAKVFVGNPYRAKNYTGVTWEQLQEGNNVGRGDPKAFARSMVNIVRQWDLPSWDRRALPIRKPTGAPADSVPPKVTFTGPVVGANGNDLKN